MDERPEETIEQNSVAEYVALRAEVLELESARQTLFLFNVAAAGTLLTFALTERERFLVAFLLPLISYLLAVRFYQHGLRKDQIGAYIRTELAPRTTGGIDWDRWVTARRPDTIVPGHVGIPPLYFAPAIFIAPGLLGWAIGVFAIVAGESFDAIEQVALTVVAVVSLAVVILTFLSWKAHQVARQTLYDLT